MAQEFVPKVKRSRNETVNDKILRGKKLLKFKRYEEALGVFDDIIAVNPGNSRIYGSAAQALMGLRHYEKALAYINQGLQLNKMDPVTCVIAGKIHLRLQNWGQALELFQQASQLDSNSPGAYFGMGRVFHEYQRYEEAIEMFRKALTLDQTYRKAYSALAKSYMAKKDQEDQEIDIRNDDVFDLIAQGSHFSMLEEEALNEIVESSSNRDLEERIADIQAITSWLEALIEQFRWQANYIKRGINSSGRYLVPEGMEEGFEEFL